MEEKVRQRQAQFELREWTLGQILDHTISRFPDNEALVYADRDFRQTWREFGEIVDRFAKGLMALGVQKGEKVAVWATNVPYWVALQFATAKIGAILVNVNPAYRLAEVEYALRHVGVRVLVTADRFKSSDYVGMLRELLPDLPESGPHRGQGLFVARTYLAKMGGSLRAENCADGVVFILGLQRAG